MLNVITKKISIGEDSILHHDCLEDALALIKSDRSIDNLSFITPTSILYNLVFDGQKWNIVLTNQQTGDSVLHIATSDIGSFTDEDLVSTFVCCELEESLSQQMIEESRALMLNNYTLVLSQSQTSP